MTAAKRKKQAAKKSYLATMSSQTKLTVLGVVAGIVILGGGWWLYVTLSTVSPPELASAEVDEVVGYFGNPNGFPRMSLDRREQYIADAYQRFGNAEDRRKLHSSLAQMTDGEKKVFLDASLEVFADRFVKQGREYRKLDSIQKKRFVDKTIYDFEGMRSELAGGGSARASSSGGGNGQPLPNLGSPFEGVAPRNKDEVVKRIWELTTPKQQEDGIELFNDVTARFKELENPTLRQAFDAQFKK